MPPFHGTPRLPDPASPADLIVGVICFSARTDLPDVAPLHRAPCRFCDVDLTELRQWLDVQNVGATAYDQFTPVNEGGKP